MTKPTPTLLPIPTTHVPVPWRDLLLAVGREPRQDWQPVAVQDVYRSLRAVALAGERREKDAGRKRDRRRAGKAGR